MSAHEYYVNCFILGGYAMQAMILAAGFGTRLLPFTKFRPKPLFPIINRPLLLLTIERLKNAGCDHIVVNCHHLRQQFIDLLSNIEGVVIQEEDTILGTGGGLRLALRSLRDEPVLVTNGDIYHSLDLLQFYESHRPEMAPITMAMHDFPRYNKVVTEKEIVVSFDGNKSLHLLAYTGLQVVNPEILEPIPLGKEWSTIDFYRKLLQEKTPIRSLRVDGCFWTDIGTPADYLELHAGLLTGKIPWWPELGAGRPVDAFYFADKHSMINTVSVKDWVCAGRVKLGRNVQLIRSVLWDGASVPDGTVVQDTIVV
jgi:mannose-1-phosphate guanylyltransferase